jgi:hypothetical protein
MAAGNVAADDGGGLVIADAGGVLPISHTDARN